MNGKIFIPIFIITSLLLVSTAYAETITVTFGNETGGQETLNDTFLMKTAGDTVQGGLAHIDVAFSLPSVSRIYIQADASGFTDIVSVNNATLFLHDEIITSGGFVSIFEVNADVSAFPFEEYAPSGYTWNNQTVFGCGNADDVNATCVFMDAVSVPTAIDDYRGWDITTVLQNEVSDDLIFAVVLNGTGADQRFHSKENGNTSRMPFILLEYENGITPSTTTTPEVTGTPATIVTIIALIVALGGIIGGGLLIFQSKKINSQVIIVGFTIAIISIVIASAIVGLV
jgi:hypothetical protein